jgi:hypothetical protein
MSFRDQVEFSMIASRERQHKERVPRIKKYRQNILPITAIYGGNASGKSNLFKALRFAKDYIVDGKRPGETILIKPFKLDEEKLKQPTSFLFDILVDETIYEYSFSVSRNEVIKERLDKITSSSEQVLYNRNSGTPYIDKSVLKEDSDLKTLLERTDSNQLFLTNSIFQKATVFKPVYSWFQKTLKLIQPESQFVPFIRLGDADDPLGSFVNEVLPKLDTGINHLERKDLPSDSFKIPEDVLQKIDDYPDAELILGQSKEKITITRSGDSLKASKLVSCHYDNRGSEVQFDFHEESDGSKRLIDLLPAIIQLSKNKSKKVYFIDEIDRSMHTLLTRKILEMFLNTVSENSRSQLIFTTHDVLQMDQDLLRRDEMWVTERETSGVSRLFSFSEYKDVRYDKDLIRSYLNGRLGGIPKILLCSDMIKEEGLEEGLVE